MRLNTSKFKTVAYLKESRFTDKAERLHKESEANIDFGNWDVRALVDAIFTQKYTLSCNGERRVDKVVCNWKLKRIISFFSELYFYIFFLYVVNGSRPTWEAFSLSPIKVVYGSDLSPTKYTDRIFIHISISAYFYSDHKIRPELQNMMTWYGIWSVSSTLHLRVSN